MNATVLVLALKAVSPCATVTLVEATSIAAARWGSTCQGIETLPAASLTDT